MGVRRDLFGRVYMPYVLGEWQVNCPKAYHPHCWKDKHGSLPSHGEQLICDWHICFNCRRSSHFQCLCCPISVCHDCLGKVGFVELRMQQKGFCTSCLNKAILIEKNTDPDPHWVRRDFSKAEIDEILFKDYWEDVKDREHLNLVYLEEAHVILNRKLDRIITDSEKFPDEDNTSDTNMFAENASVEKTIAFDAKGKQNKANTSLKKGKTNKKTYIGWGSEELIQFLSSSGKDTSKPLDEADIIGVIMAYIKQKNLFRNNKKSFLCDDKLLLLFGRRKVSCKSIRRLLAVHLAANDVSEDETLYDSEDDDVPITKKKSHFDGSEHDDGGIMKKKPRNSLELKIVERVSERNKRCFASLNENNIKLIYLRRSLVINLLDHPDTFDQKVVGCFVRVKNAPRAHIYEMPKKPYQLGLVTGIKKSSEEYKMKDTCTNILLCVTGLWDDVRVSMLSDEDFAEEECDDLVSLVKKGLLERPTIAALEKKVATVHKDIVNHWIDKELVRLDRAIDRANIKGWRQEFEELMHQQELLRTEAERMRRLEEVPEITAETEQDGNETEHEVAANNSSQENRGAKQKVANSLTDFQEEPSKGAAEDLQNTNTFLSPLSLGVKEVANFVHDHQEEPPKENVLKSFKCLRVHEEKLIEGNINTLLLPFSPGVIEGASSSNGLQVQPMKGATGDGVESVRVHKEKPTKDGSSSGTMDTDRDETKHSRRKNKGGANVEEAINLDSDEYEDLHIAEHRTEGNTSHALRATNGAHLPMDQTESASLVPLHASGAMNADLHLEQHEAAVSEAMNVVSPHTPLWNYLDPQGNIRGPFALTYLFRWRGFFDKDFKVWRTGETMEQAILLQDVFLMHL
ncbi:zinc finger CCCH domain-containing protein 44-like isoform X3 [Panicum virgatum]|uniref:zinc finger CCCH domain-containing protein 44-like isoform X3 n=1 Tax=Panicum virgatum TaxID=38727 RepID=UPI0019D57D53|nr:zinc finger CCCH domain-containing protein 44-like isoform X3 [Panicum virgatum]